MEKYLLGIDIGSGGGKVSLLNPHRDEAFTRVSEYPTYFPQAGWAEQDAEDWISSTGMLIKELLKESGITPSQIQAVGIGGVTHSPVLLDKKRNIIRRTIHLTDTRSVLQAKSLKNRAGDLFLRTCLNPVNVMWTVVMLLWVKENEPEVWNNLSKLLFPKDYVRFRLTGTEVTDYIDAQGTLLFNVAQNRWDDKLLALIELKRDTLPEVVKPEEVVGRVTEQGSEWSGLEEGTPVIAGSTDTLLELLAAGSARPGDCTVKLATFGRICVITDIPYADEKLITYSYIIPGLWYPGTGTKSFASSLKWFRDQFCRDIHDHPHAFSIMEREATGTPPGAESLIFQPYLQGEGSPYNDPLLRGSFIGLTLHHSRGHLIRAVMEGTSFSLLDSLNFIQEKGIEVKLPLRFIGGGTQSALWLNILSDVLGSDGVVPRATDPSVGAALLAGVGTGLYGTVQEAQERCSGYIKQVQPTAERTQLYRSLFHQYKKAHDILVDMNHDLSRLSL
jgi:xylulokinase